MSKIENKNEAHFQSHELFFSYTDKKGLIQGGNSVFTRVSELTEEELYLKPHNIIRHYDMPKTIFKLFWQTLEEDLPIVAYVKNKSKTGKYYWVLAMAFPVQDGYISIRLKPTSAFFKTVVDLYEELLAREIENKDLEVNVQWVLGKLRELGFNSYKDFMYYVLPLELTARDKVISHETQGKVSVTAETKISKTIYLESQSILEVVKGLIEQETALQDSFYHMNMITKNMMIATAQFGSIGRTTKTIAENLQMLTAEIQKGSIVFSEHFQTFLSTVQGMVFHIAMIHFQIEMLNYPEDLSLSKIFSQSVYKSKELMSDLVSKNISCIKKGMQKIELINHELENSLADFIRISLGMNVICVSGRIEIAHMSVHKDTTDITEQLLDMKAKNEGIKATLKLLLELLLTEVQQNATIDVGLDDLARSYHASVRSKCEMFE